MEPARERRRPITAQTANNFFVNLGPALSVSATSADTGISDRIEEVYLALISSKHEIGRVRIIWIALRRATSSRDHAINHCKITFKFNLQRRSHALLVGLDRGIQPGDGLQIGTFTGNKSHWSGRRRRCSACRDKFNWTNRRKISVGFACWDPNWWNVW